MFDRTADGVLQKAAKKEKGINVGDWPGSYWVI